MASCYYFGASVKGPQHRRARTACQDAWRGRHFATGGSVVIVADGMGSRKEAARGARKAASAATKAFRNWSVHPSVEIEWMLRWLESQWRMEVAPWAPQDCATTCLLAGWSPESALVIAGLGDGMILCREHHQPVRRILGRGHGSALNETTALGCDHRLGDWVTVRLEPRSPWAVILMTDGVADDLQPKRLNEFSSWLLDDVALRDPASRNEVLRDALANWPTPGHSDDKTIAVLVSS